MIDHQSNPAASRCLEIQRDLTRITGLTTHALLTLTLTPFPPASLLWLLCL